MSWGHLAEIVPAKNTPLGVRIVENVPIGLMFVGCVRTEDCIDSYGVLTPYNSYSPCSSFRCNQCQHVYTIPTGVVSDTLSNRNYFDSDGQYWFSVWLGVARNQVGVFMAE